MPSNTLLFSFGATRHEVKLPDNAVAVALNVPVGREIMLHGREAYDTMRLQIVRDALSDADMRTVDDIVTAIDLAVEKQNKCWEKITNAARPESDKYVAVYFTVDHHA